MTKFAVTANGERMKIFDAEDKEAAIEAYARDAGYRDVEEARCIYDPPQSREEWLAELDVREVTYTIWWTSEDGQGCEEGSSGVAEDDIDDEISSMLEEMLQNAGGEDHLIAGIYDGNFTAEKDRDYR
jgi:hypothetical protein